MLTQSLIRGLRSAQRDDQRQEGNAELRPPTFPLYQDMARQLGLDFFLLASIWASDC